MNFDVEIFRKLIKDFDADEESEELQGEYLSVFSHIKSIKLRNELKKLEKLLNQKNLFDMVYAYRMGGFYAKKHPEIDIRKQLLGDIADMGVLHSIDEYDAICQDIRHQRKNVYAATENEEKAVDLLLEIYSYYNYELIKYAFKSAYKNR